MLKNSFLFALTLILIFSCETKSSKYPLEKRYWTIEDYDNVIKHIKYGIKSEDDLPTLKNPETRVVLEKLTDPQNYLVVLNDKELGLKYKNKFGSDFFNKWTDMTTIYDKLDKTDKYKYEIENLKVWQFGLGLQVKYFYLGNENILKNSDESDSYYTNSTIKSNEETIINNFNIYLDELNSPEAYSKEGIEFYNDGLRKYFTKLIEAFPKANYKDMEKKIGSVTKKAKYNSTKKELQKILELIASKKVNKEEVSTNKS